MEALKKRYIIDENNKKVAVQLDIRTFRKIEDIMENYVLYHLIKENEKIEKLDINSAKKYYSQLEKSI